MRSACNNPEKLSYDWNLEFIMCHITRISESIVHIPVVKALEKLKNNFFSGLVWVVYNLGLLITLLAKLCPLAAGIACHIVSH